MNRIRVNAQPNVWRTIALITMFLLVGSVLVLAGRPAHSQTTGDVQTQMIPASFSEVAQKASPAVVNISTVKHIKAGQPYPFQGRFQGRGPMGPEDFFNDFFEQFFGRQMPMPDREERSLGSGFIIDPAGYILTNNHVVDGADDIVVQMSDEKEFHAKVLGRDPKTDLALIKIEGQDNLPYLALGDSDKVRVGDWVVAIGNPFGLEHTVTAGILSARGRAIGAGPYDDFLQTDTSINPGNSGGPLLNLAGEVIGINTAIVPQGQGIGFAIPAKLAQGIVDQLKASGRVVRGWLGVMIQRITPELAKSFKLEQEIGALVSDVAPKGPADEAGLKRGDVIVSFNGQAVKNSSDLPTLVAKTPVGEKVSIQVIRDGKTVDLTAKIGELKEEASYETAPAKNEDLGLNVQDLTPQLAQRLGIDDTDGVIVSGVAAGSPADKAGLKPGDVIVEINRAPIKNMDDYRQQIERLAKDAYGLFLVKRGQNTLFFTLKG